MALFRMAFFSSFRACFSPFRVAHFVFSSFRLALFRLFVISLGVFRYFVFSLGVISSWHRAITPGEKTNERNNEMAQTSHHRENDHGLRQGSPFRATQDFSHICFVSRQNPLTGKTCFTIVKLSLFYQKMRL